MREYIRSNFQFIALCSLWVLVGILLGSIPALAFVLLSVLLLKRKNMYPEMFLGFLLVLILSDSRSKGLSFAIDVKVLYILMLAFFFFFDRKNFSSSSKVFIYFAPFLILGVCLTIISDNWLSALQKSISYALLIFVVPNYVVNVYKEHGPVFLKNIVFLFSAVLLIGLVFKFVDPKVATLAGRYRGILGNPNGLGLFCTVFFLLYYLVQDYFPDLFSQRERIFVYFVLIASMYLCGSRNAIMSIILFLLFTRLYKISPYFGFLIFCTILVGYEVLFQNFGLIVRSLGLGEYFRIETLETGSGRNIAWTFAWEQIQHNFYFGKGFAYDEILFKEHYEELSIKGHQGNAHNSYLTIWINTGIFGLALFFRGFLISFLKGAKNSRLAFPVMFAILFSANFESWMAASLNPFTIQMFIIITILVSPEFNKQEDESSVPVQ